MNNLKLTYINNYRLNEINKVKGYFNDEINERKYKRYKRRKKYDIIKIIYHFDEVIKL